jgi:N-acetylglucosamine-6-sulfatase
VRSFSFFFPFRRRLRALLVLSGLAAAVASAASVPASQARPKLPERLNVVVILSDDERTDGTSVMKNVQSLLADHGVTFTDYHVTSSLCGPSRASILSGQYSHHTGVYDNFGPHSVSSFNASSTLATWLHSSGYQTALVGKYINAYTTAEHHVIPPGWDDWQALDSIPMEAYYNYTLNENGKLVHFGHTPSDYSTNVLTNKAVDFIHTARKPFFLYYAPVAPHLPAIPAKQDQGKLENIAPIHSPAFNQRNIGKEPWRFWHKDMLKAAAQLYINHVRIRQLESLLAIDRGVKRIVAELKARHELDHTVIVYTSDNGFLWGEHRLGGKIWPYQESTNVPLIVRAPWTTSATTNRQPVLNVDLAPTISALAGVAPGLPEDGSSFLPMLHGIAMPTWRKSFLVEFLGKSKLPNGPPPYIAVQSKQFLYVNYFNGWRELYNLKRDPWELDNVAESPAYQPTDRALQVLVHELYAAPATRP